MSKEKRIRAEKILIGAHIFSEPYINMIATSHRKIEELGFFGTSLLNKGRYIVDYDESRLYFFPYQVSPSWFAKSARQSFYITLSLGYPIVYQQNINAPKEIASVPRGSRLTRLNGRDIRDYTDEERRSITHGRSGAEFSFCYQKPIEGSDQWGPEHCVATELELV